MVVISNGFNKFILSIAAAEAHRRGILTSMITGAYPTHMVTRSLTHCGLAANRKVARLLARREKIDDELVHPLWMPEAVNVLAVALRPSATAVSPWLDALSMRYYGRLAAKYVREAATRDARIYHYRAGFGHESVREAKRLGLVTLCDHSIVHPALLDALISLNGRFPAKGESTKIDPLWSEILFDIEQADAVLVNSDFVAETFRQQGYDAERLHVLYLGVDDTFLDTVPARIRHQSVSGPLRLLFAGSVSRRKGADTLIAALKLLGDVPWRLEVAGSIDPEMQNDSQFLSEDSRVSMIGWLSRNELAERMSAAEVFVFPSLAEGSARVVFEALAAGCYVITTRNTGSIVEDGVHGRLVPPGDAPELAAAIRDAALHRSRLEEIGVQNADLVRTSYRQCHYGERLVSLYENLLPL